MYDFLRNEFYTPRHSNLCRHHQNCVTSRIPSKHSFHWASNGFTTRHKCEQADWWLLSNLFFPLFTTTRCVTLTSIAALHVLTSSFSQFLDRIFFELWLDEKLHLTRDNRVAKLDGAGDGCRSSDPDMTRYDVRCDVRLRRICSPISTWSIDGVPTTCFSKIYMQYICVLTYLYPSKMKYAQFF